jgi:ABC-2 type transport system permease protein
MTTATMPRVATLASTETQLVVRNRTLLIGSVIVPLALGVFWLFTFSSGRAVVPPLQFGMAIGLGVYVTATQTLVARRHSLVLKRLRTTGLPDNGILVATVAPAVVVGVALLAVFTVLDAVMGVPILTDPLPLLLAVVATMAMVIAAAMATAGLTPAPERTNVTTLPLSFLLLGGTVAMTFAPVGTWWDAVLLVPGAGLGRLMALAGNGQTWAPDVAGLPAVVLPVVSLVLWTFVFGRLSRRWFRWDRRH